MKQTFQPGAHPDAEQLSLFVEGAATAREREQMLAHLAGCADCRQVMFLMQRSEKQDAAPAASSRERNWHRFLLPAGLAGAALACGLMVALVYMRLQNGTRQGVQQIASNEKPQAGLNGKAVAPTDKFTSAGQQPLQIQPLMPQGQASGFARHSTSVRATRQTGGPSNLTARNSSFSAGAAGAIGRGEIAASAQPVPAIAPAAPPSPPAAQTGASVGMAMSLAERDITNPQPLAAPAAAQRPIQKARSVSQANLPVLRIEQGKHNDTLSGVSGRVTDQSGAGVAKATVALRDAIGNTRQTTTGADGTFMVSEVAEGHYDLTVTAQGFQSNRQPIDLKRGEVAMLQPVLNVGSATETVTVVSNAPLLETESGSVDQITAELPSRLPAIATATLGKRILSLDSTGSLFLSRNAGRIWKKVRPRWSGKVVRIQVTPSAAGIDSGKDGSSTGVSSTGVSGQGYSGSAGAQRTFQLITEAGTVWTSEDGKHWRQQ